MKGGSTHEEAEKAVLYLLFRYSLLQQKHEEPATNQITPSGLQSMVTDRQMQDKIMSCVESHDASVIQKIQKRRGRKRFILSNDEQLL